jgi:hypothetical protein
MTGFEAFKYYMALKLHFTTPTFNVFTNQGRIKGTRQAFFMRNDHVLFEKLAKHYSTGKDYIQFIAANFMYGNPNVVYDAEQSLTNYKEFLRRRQSITRVFTDDLNTILCSGAQLNFSGSSIPEVLQLFVANKITIETMVILNDLRSIVEQMKQTPQVALVLGDDLLRIEKSKGFVKYDAHRVLAPYHSFLEEIRN